MFFKKKEDDFKIIKSSNVIQYDEMGYPLRLVVISNNKQIWIDTEKEKGDVVLEWRGI